MFRIAGNNCTHKTITLFMAELRGSWYVDFFLTASDPVKLIFSLRKPHKQNKHTDKIIPERFGFLLDYRNLKGKEKKGERWEGDGVIQ